MLADGARTGTVGCGSWMDLPADLGPGLRGAVAADERDGGAWRAGHIRCQTPPPARRRPDRVLASAGRDFGPRLTGCLFPAWLTWHHGAVGRPAEPGRAPVAGTVSPLCRNAVLPYSRQTSAGVRAGRGPRTARRAFRAQDAGARHACRATAAGTQQPSAVTAGPRNLRSPRREPGVQYRAADIIVQNA